jgi:hypothetical protein
MVIARTMATAMRNGNDSDMIVMGGGGVMDSGMVA